jgi:hypothetical protein
VSTQDPGISAISARYTRFADLEARGRSPLYEEIARGVAGDRDVLAFLLRLPEEKRQPNLLLAAVRHHCGTPSGWHGFREALLGNCDAVHAVMLGRSTQTNEPARCATLLPLLARLPAPLALIEVGASAGLCLLPDCYGYDYGRGLITPRGGRGEGPLFTCAVNAATPIPDRLPEIVWRAGLDLNPIDVNDGAQMAWLETLVWPDQPRRLANLRAAIRIAAAQTPRVVKGDLLGDGLAKLCGEAPGDATLVVFHSATVAYIARAEKRQAFAQQAMSLCRYWISNEYPRVFPNIANRAGARDATGDFLLAMNGVPIAWTDPHGAAIKWIG